LPRAKLMGLGAGARNLHHPDTESRRGLAERAIGLAACRFRTLKAATGGGSAILARQSTCTPGEGLQKPVRRRGLARRGGAGAAAARPTVNRLLSLRPSPPCGRRRAPWRPAFSRRPVLPTRSCFRRLATRESRLLLRRGVG